MPLHPRRLVPRPLRLHPTLQLSMLRGLCDLEVSCWKMEPDSFGALAALSSLQHLMLTNACLPDTLPQLTWLRSLHMEAFERVSSGILPGLEAVLPSLQQLTALALGSVPLWRPGLLAALDALPLLQRLSVACAWEGYGNGPQRGPSTLPQADLPAPAFLGRLTWLGIDGDLLTRNPHLLEAASQLQHLRLLGNGMRLGGYERPFRHLMKLVRQHPQLRSLSLLPSHNWSGYVEPDVTWFQWRDLLALQRARPDLAFHDSPPGSLSLDEIWGPFFAVE